MAENINKINEAGVDPIHMTRDQLVSAGVTTMKGFGGKTLTINDHGYVVNPADSLPEGLFGKLKSAWESSNGSADTFFSQNIDGQSVKSILQQCPSQQSYGIAKALDLPQGTNVPCISWSDHDYGAIKWGSSAAGDAAATAAGAGEAAAEAAGVSAPIIPITPEIALVSLLGAAGIIAIIKALNNTIKSRFRKCCKVLYKMQKDFVSPDGLSMSKVMPGIGSKLTDLWAWFKGPKGKSKNKGTIGIVPFLDRYQEEINLDYRDAINAFNSIIIAGKSTPTENESTDTTYKSIREALSTVVLAEGISKDSEVTAVEQFVDPRNIYANGNNFIIKTSDGQTKTIQVTKESTREICCAIMNQFLNKYINTKSLYTKLGLTAGLGEIDNSNVQKFEKLLGAYKNSSDSHSSKMYARLEQQYKIMVDDYLKMGNRLIDNFVKYTKNKKGDAAKASIDQKNLKEKDDNLLFDSETKLRSAWRAQEDYFKNNFGKVLTALTKSEEYQKYINFILEKVMPIFKTGLAGDADPILDILPKKDEIYFVRQTQSQNKLDNYEDNNGNVAAVKIISCDWNKRTVAFEILGKVNGNIVASSKKKGLYELAPDANIDTSAYKDDNGNNRTVGAGTTDNKGVTYGSRQITLQQWASLDPYQATGIDGNGKIIGIDDKLVPTTYVYTKVIDDTNNPQGPKRKIYIFAQGDQKEFEAKLNSKNESVDSSIGSSYKTDDPLNEDGAPDKSYIENIVNQLNIHNGNIEEVEKEIAEHPELLELNPADNVAKEFHINFIYIGTINDETELAADTSVNRFSGASVKLQEQCTFEEFHNVLHAAGYAHNKENGEKSIIEEKTNPQKGYTHTNANLNSIKDLPEYAENEVAIRKTEAEKLKIDAKEITNLISNTAKEKGVLDPNKYYITKYYGNYIYGWNPNNQKDEYKYRAQIQNSIPLADNNIDNIIDGNKYNISGDHLWFAITPTTIAKKDSNGAATKQIYFVIRPALFGQDGNEIKIPVNKNQPVIPDSTQLKSRVGFYLQSSNHFDVKGLADGGTAAKCTNINDINSVHTAVNTYIDNLAKAGEIEAVTGDNTVDSHKHTGDVSSDTNATNISATPESIQFIYNDLFSLAESFMGSIMGPMYLKVYRKITTNSKEDLYVLSENEWGDGSVTNPVGVLTESIDKHLNMCKTYDDFARLSKSSISINFMKITEDCSYKTRLPYNRYKMLTEINPLYEAAVVIAFNDDNTVKYTINKGVIKIAK